MLKMAIFAPAFAPTPTAPSPDLTRAGSRVEKILNVPTWEKNPSRRVRGGRMKWYASGFFSPAALLDGHFEHPEGLYTP
jgi:hypothetical protein